MSGVYSMTKETTKAKRNGHVFQDDYYATTAGTVAGFCVAGAYMFLGYYQPFLSPTFNTSLMFTLVATDTLHDQGMRANLLNRYWSFISERKERKKALKMAKLQKKLEKKLRKKMRQEEEEEQQQQQQQHGGKKGEEMLGEEAAEKEKMAHVQVNSEGSKIGEEERA